MARLAQGTKVLTEGGQDNVFQHTFEILPGEKLLMAYACHLSTSTGPVIGTLYLSNKRLAFCSDNPLCQYSPSGQQQWMYYKGLNIFTKGGNMQIMHFDFKPYNSLLDKRFTPKVLDFVLVKLYPDELNTAPLTAARGAFGCMAAELVYNNFGGVSYKADVCSLGK
ncbi:rust resistance kinase Lr10-like [Syzygium oleosum]|uniref:rust resistance kinase Lr10-like n=1 Tax=Syzygium oleosum TaxID=219896 RepID=UPI0024BAA473|nr:rust resistance kinase Lr10-like [Syzygium oleosum]